MRKSKNNAYPKQKRNYHLLRQRQEPRIVQSAPSYKSLYFSALSCH